MGGMGAEKWEWPWQVSLRNGNQHFCGGSLITKKWIVSAAHCVYNREKTLLRVYLGSFKLDQPDQEEKQFGVNNIIIHPDYDRNLLFNDISLLELDREVDLTEYIIPVCIPSVTVKFPTGLECWVTGWGTIRPSVRLPYPRILQQVAVPLIDSTSCTRFYNTPSSRAVITKDGHICAGYINGGKDSCQGDSGGPLVCSTENRWFLAGVVSYGESCGKPYRPGVYTLLTSYTDFIVSKVPSVAQNVKSGTFRDPIISMYNSSATTIFIPTFLITILLVLLLRQGSFSLL
ncbi:hypothetical protein GDO86_017736 [Hymenochirus boettgeri]|uniref:Peptidase S1 domain-containing protein n=1 Tax=Hymenochirus boettgeri TaxID=247094 RepID=A0A8T2IPN7_9PIPI|nr:hypothetical protein GDO86_017736 [Hymenochirus boettgeri]